MRMTASRLDPAIGSAEHKTRRALFAHDPGRLASDRLVFARSGETPTGRTRPEPAAVLWPVKKWPGNAAAR
jgi:hypothetical protein